MADTRPPCGEAERLQALLDDRLPEAEQAELTAHLESCATCRRAFDELAGGSRWWSDVRRYAPGAASPGPDAATVTMPGAGSHPGDLGAETLPRQQRSTSSTRPPSPAISGGSAPTGCWGSSDGAGWVSYSGRSTRRCTGRWRSRCSPPSWPSAPRPGGDSSARPVRRPPSSTTTSSPSTPSTRRRFALPGHAAGRGQVAAGPPRPGGPAGTGRDPPDRPSGAAGPGRGARAGPGPPRHQAREHPA